MILMFIPSAIVPHKAYFNVVTFRITAWFHETISNSSNGHFVQFYCLRKAAAKLFADGFYDTPSIEISSYLRSVSPTPETSQYSQ